MLNNCFYRCNINASPVLAMDLRLSSEWIELVFGTAAFLGISYTGTVL